MKIRLKATGQQYRPRHKSWKRCSLRRINVYYIHAKMTLLSAYNARKYLGNNTYELIGVIRSLDTIFSERSSDVQSFALKATDHIFKFDQRVKHCACSYCCN